MNKLILAILIALIAAATPGEAAAQGKSRSQPRDRDEQPQLPSRYNPPAGMCRIWLEGVPPSRQPAPTDCIKALRNKPANGRVIFGDPLPSSRSKGRSGNPFGVGPYAG